MQVKTFRANNMQAALSLVRRELGPDAAVLRTREVRGGGLLRWLVGGRVVEISATTDVLPPRRAKSRPAPVEVVSFKTPSASGVDLARVSAKPQAVPRAAREIKGRVENLPQSLFRLFTDLIEAEIHEDIAREWIERLRGELTPAELNSEARLRARVTRLIEDELHVSGPIRVTAGQPRLVALVGPTGVGKTTTIAKLAANFRLTERQRVGLITVDTFRIAAVEQLRTYADIIDLPMEVVSTPEEMRQAVTRLADLDLILLDTAGRSPRDDEKIQELRTMLAEACPDEVHLVLSATCSATSLSKTAACFAEVGVTSLLLTKLDEASGLGSLLPLMRSCSLPLSYLTNGQNVPDDIEPADSARLARLMLGNPTSLLEA